MFRRPIPVLACLLAATGCGSPAPTAAPPADGGHPLSGSVTVNGKPLPHGTVFVYTPASQNPAGRARIQADGTYRVRNLPAGPVQLLVTTSTQARSPAGIVTRPGPPDRPPPPGVDPDKVPRPGGTPAPPDPATAQLYTAIDLKYGTFEGGGKLLTTVAAGDNKFDLDLTATADPAKP